MEKKTKKKNTKEEVSETQTEKSKGRQRIEGSKCGKGREIETTRQTDRRT